MSLEKSLMRLGLQNIMISKLVNVTFNQDNLRECIEKIILGLNDHIEFTQKNFMERSEQFLQVSNEMKEVKEKFRDVGERFQGQIERVNDLNEMLGASRKQVQQITNSSTQQFTEIQQLQEQFQELIQKQEHLKKQQVILDAKIYGLEANSNKGPIGFKSEDIEKMKLEFKEQYLSKEDYEIHLLESSEFKDFITERMTALSTINPSQIETQLKEFYAKITPIEEQLRTKLDSDIFDDEVDRIKNILINHSTLQGTQVPVAKVEQVFQPSIKSKELMEMREQLRKIDDCQIACINFEKKFESMKYKEYQQRLLQVEEYQKKLTLGGFEELTIRVDTMRQFYNKVEQYWDPLLNKVTEHKASIQELKAQNESQENWLRRLREFIDETKTQPAQGKLSQKMSSSALSGRLAMTESKKQIDDRFQEVDEEIYKTKELFQSRFKLLSTQIEAINNTLLKKLDTDTFNNFRDEQLKGFKNDLYVQLQQFADKSWINNTLERMQTSIAALYMALEQISKNVKDDDEAMFSKKGFQCASCDKNLLNLQASVGQYNSWQRLPLKDPMDRIARIGKGFSKMLGKVRVDQIQPQSPMSNAMLGPISINEDLGQQSQMGYRTHRQETTAFGDNNDIDYIPSNRNQMMGDHSKASFFKTQMKLKKITQKNKLFSERSISQKSSKKNLIFIDYSQGSASKLPEVK